MTPKLFVTQREHAGLRFWCIVDAEGKCAWFTSSWETVLTAADELATGRETFPGMQWLAWNEWPSPKVVAGRRRHLARKSWESWQQDFMDHVIMFPLGGAA